MDKPSVFISYNHNSKNFVDELINRLDGFADVHWDQNVGQWESFQKFMNTIRSQDYAVMIISDNYLHSDACLYEVLQLISVKEWDKKALYVVEDSARAIYDRDGRLTYVKYWEDQYNEFEKKVTNLSLETAASQVNELEKLRLIKANIGDFLKKVSDSKNPDAWKAIDAIIERVKISGKRNTSSELEDEIVSLINSGNNTIVGIAKATNRTQSTISHYIRKMRIDGKISVIGMRRNRILVVN